MSNSSQDNKVLTFSYCKFCDEPSNDYLTTLIESGIMLKEVLQCTKCKEMSLSILEVNMEVIESGGQVGGEGQ